MKWSIMLSPRRQCDLPADRIAEKLVAVHKSLLASGKRPLLPCDASHSRIAEWVDSCVGTATAVHVQADFSLMLHCKLIPWQFATIKRPLCGHRMPWAYGLVGCRSYLERNK